MGKYWYICSWVTNNPNIDFWVVSLAEFHIDNRSCSYLRWDWKFLFLAECLLPNTIGNWITSQHSIKLLFKLALNHNELPFDIAPSTMLHGKLKYLYMIGLFQKWKSGEHRWLVANIVIKIIVTYLFGHGQHVTATKASSANIFLGWNQISKTFNETRKVQLRKPELKIGTLSYLPWTPYLLSYIINNEMNKENIERNNTKAQAMLHSLPS